MSREEEFQLIHNILAAFEAAPKRPVVQRNPATAEAWRASVTIPNVGTVEIFHSVVWGDICNTEHLVMSLPSTDPKFGVEIFRAERGCWWTMEKASPLAWMLFGQQPDHFFAMPTHTTNPTTL